MKALRPDRHIHWKSHSADNSSKKTQDLQEHKQPKGNQKSH